MAVKPGKNLEKMMACLMVHYGRIGLAFATNDAIAECMQWWKQQKMVYIKVMMAVFKWELVNSDAKMGDQPSILFPGHSC